MKTANLAAIALLVLLGGAAATAQMMTERYVPIGQSPGISGKSSTIGTITAVDRDAHTMTVEGESGARTYRVTEDTHIWLDRSGWQLSNLDADYSDCAVGRRVEVMHEPDDESVADWIKVEARDKQ